jgi:hypothetical protein
MTGNCRAYRFGWLKASAVISEASYFGGCSSPFHQPVGFISFQRVATVAFEALERACSLVSRRQRQHQTGPLDNE